MMRTFFVVLALLVVGVVGLGFYQGWFSFTSNNAKTESTITLTVDKDKIQEDTKEVTESVQDLGNTAKD